MGTGGLSKWILLSIHLISLAPSAVSLPAGISTSTQQKISVSNNELKTGQEVSNDELATDLTDQKALPISDKKLEAEFENGTCYKEFNVSWEFRDLSSVVPGECMAGCASQGYFYAAIMGGSICSCGNDQPPQSTIVNTEACDVKCEGGDAQSCGGANARNFYKLYTVSTFETVKIRTKVRISSNDSFYTTDQMVFTDDEEREALLAPTHLLKSGFLNGSCYSVSNVTWEVRNISTVVPEECMAGCASQGYFYAAIMGGSICSCGNDQPPQSTIVNSEACDVKCEGDETQNCGGTDKMKVFEMFTGSTFQSNDSKIKIRIGIATRIKFNDGRFYIKD